MMPFGKMFHFLIVMAICFSSGEVFANKLKLFRATITHYDNSQTRGTLYRVGADGIYLVKAKDVVALSREALLRSIENGSLKTIRVPYNEVKNIAIRRRGASGRNFLLGAGGALVVAAGITAIATESASREEGHCGCGPPAMLIIPPVMGILGGVAGSIIGLFPKKVVRLDPDKPFESARRSIDRYSLAGQLTIQ